MVSVCSTSLFRDMELSLPSLPSLPSAPRALRAAPARSTAGNPKRFSPFLDAIGFQHFFLKMYYTTYIQHINMNIYTYTKCVQHASICIVCICMPYICFCV